MKIDDDKVRDFQWLEGHVAAAIAEVASWPEWKSRASTLSESSTAASPRPEGDKESLD